MKATFAVLVLCGGLFVAAVPAAAHHSISGDYFMDQKATVEGDMVQFLYRNPHSFVELKAKDPRTGDLVTWSIEWNGAGRLGRVGVTADSLKPGDHVIIIGQPGRKPEDHRMHLLDISRPSDGWKWNRAANHY
jgi:Family of unknown function (DUF6152)